MGVVAINWVALNDQDSYEKAFFPLKVTVTRLSLHFKAMKMPHSYSIIALLQIILRPIITYHFFYFTSHFYIYQQIYLI